MIGVSNFVKRQTKNSSHGYFDGSWEELVKLVSDNFDKQIPGYRPGVILVPVPPERFYTSMCKLDENSILETTFEKRWEGEEPVLKTVVVNGKKSPAKFVKIVLYSHEVLKETNEQSTDDEWEIISINASLVENEPMHPMTMARNMLQKAGGTKGEYTGQQFAEALWFWREYAPTKGE